jgi:hypothetical protein
MIKQYKCEICNYESNIKSNLNRHLKSLKHINIIELYNKNNENLFVCNICNQTYNHRQSLHKHKKSCKEKTNICIEYKEKEKESEKDIIIMELEKKLKEIVKEAIGEMPVNQIINNNANTIIDNSVKNSNNTINIQVFLNEHCKDAITIQHFAKNLAIQLDDIINKEHGKFYGGITNIVIDNLKPLSITQRPIHCTDIKHSKWMVNDAKEGWKEDNGSKVIKQTELTLFKIFNYAWDKKYPGWSDNDDLKDRWLKLIHLLTMEYPDYLIVKALKKIGPECNLTIDEIRKII